MTVAVPAATVLWWVLAFRRVLPGPPTWWFRPVDAVGLVLVAVVVGVGAFRARWRQGAGLALLVLALAVVVIETLGPPRWWSDALDGARVGASGTIRTSIPVAIGFAAMGITWRRSSAAVVGGASGLLVALGGLLAVERAADPFRGAGGAAATGAALVAAALVVSEFRIPRRVVVAVGAVVLVAIVGSAARSLGVVGSSDAAVLAVFGWWAATLAAVASGAAGGRVAEASEPMVEAEVDTPRAGARHGHELLESASGVHVTREQLEVFVEPIVALADGRPVAWEVRVRAVDRGRRVVPDRLLAGLEQSGRLVEVGDWVIDRAVALAASLPDDMRVHVDLSAGQVGAPFLLERLGAALARHDVPAHRLRVEVSEHTLLDTAEATRRGLRGLVDAGVGLAVAAFGTGFETLPNLAILPVEAVKLPRSLSGTVVEDEVPADVSAISALVAERGLVGIAEGIDSVDQAGALSALGWRFGQGPLFGGPRPPELAVPEASLP